MTNEPLPPPTKKCQRCGRELLTSSFYPSSDTADGVGTVCRSCLATSSRVGRPKKCEGCNPALAPFTPRELIAELRARGYCGELQYTTTIKV